LIHIWGGGVGHFVEYEKREEFNRLVIGFLTLDETGETDQSH